MEVISDNLRELSKVSLWKTSLGRQHLVARLRVGQFLSQEHCRQCGAFTTNFFRITRALECLLEGELHDGFVSCRRSLTASTKYFLGRLAGSHQRRATAALTAAGGISLTEAVHDLPDCLALS